jgi:hypothetical protein
MHNLQSIILFNGGSCGDFLKTICISQLYAQSLVVVNPDGRAKNYNEYFKKLCAERYPQVTMPELDWSQISLVENAHHYLPWQSQLCNSVWYIDYPDACQSTVVDVYIKKARKNSLDYLWQRELELGLLNNVPESLRHCITPDNITMVVIINWNKNLKAWRTNTSLSPINLEDFFDLEKFTKIVSSVSKLSIDQLNYELLRSQYYQWQIKNQELQGMFK